MPGSAPTKAPRRSNGGPEGPSSYSGKLEVTPGGDGAQLTVRLHTTRVNDGDSEVQKGLDETLANVKRLVEQRGRA